MLCNGQTSEESVIAVYRRAGELYWHLEKILLIGELSMSCDGSMGFRFEFRTTIGNRPYAASLNLTLQELLSHPDLASLAKRVATPWVDTYCRKVDENSCKEH